MTKPKKSKNYIPVTVPFGAIPAGETPSIAQWAHRTVWTDRMLDTLLQGKVREGKWHTLIDKVMDPQNLRLSATKVLGNEGAPGVDRQTVGDFHEGRQEELDRLQHLLREDQYRPSPVRRTWIPKPGSTEKRPLGIPTFPGIRTSAQRAFGLRGDYPSVSSASR